MRVHSRPGPREAWLGSKSGYCAPRSAVHFRGSRLAPMSMLQCSNEG
jgi:hypothetical protein